MTDPFVGAGTLMSAGDGISQLGIEGGTLREYDVLRSGRYFVLGFCAIVSVDFFLSLFFILFNLFNLPHDMCCSNSTMGCTVLGTDEFAYFVCILTALVII